MSYPFSRAQFLISVVFTVEPAPDGPACNATATTGAAAHLAGVGDVLSEGRAELFRVLRVQVDLVFSTVEREPYGSLCRPAVNVVYEECRDLLGHLDSAFLVSTAIINDWLSC